MDQPTIIQKIEQRLQELLAQTPDYFLVALRIKPTNNIKVFVDGDHGFSIDDSIKLNRKLYAQLEADGLFPDGDFSLEVSSPGIGEPLLSARQFKRNLGRLLEIELVDADRLMSGILKMVDDEGFVLEITEGNGKKATTSEHRFQYDQVKKAVVLVKF